MESMNTDIPLKVEKNFQSIISSTMMRKRFSNTMIRSIIAANSKGLNLEISFANDLPDFFFGDEGLIYDIAAAMLDSSIANTVRGIVRIGISADKSIDQDEWWLNISVDDCSDGTPPHLVNYVYGSDNDLCLLNPHQYPIYNRLRILRKKSHLIGGEMLLVNLSGNPTDSSCTGNLYLASLPFRIVSTDQQTFRQNYMV